MATDEDRRQRRRLRGLLRGVPCPSFHVFGGLPPAALALLAATFVDRLGTFVVTFLALYLTSVRGLSVADAGLVASAWGAGTLVGAPVGGVLADGLGRRRTLVLGYVGVAVALLALAAARSLPAIAICTALVGVQGAIHRPAASAALTDLVDEADRVRVFSLFYWVVNLAFSMSPILGSQVARLGFTTLFVVDALTSLACAVLLWRFVPKTRLQSTADQRRASPRDAVVAIVDPRFAGFLFLSLLIAVVFHQIDVSLPVDARAHGVDLDTWAALLAMNGVLIVVVQPALVQRIERLPLHLVLAAGSLLTGLGFALHGLWTSVVGYGAGIVLWTLGEILWAPMTPLVDKGPSKKPKENGRLPTPR